MSNERNDAKAYIVQGDAAEFLPGDACVSITVSEPLTEGSTAKEWERLEWTEIGPSRCIQPEISGGADTPRAHVSREVAARFARAQFLGEFQLDAKEKFRRVGPNAEKGRGEISAWHYGACEVRQLLDLIYGAPRTDAERLTLDE